MKHFFIALSILIVPLFSIGQNVGIGTNSPQHKLDVVGDINLTGALRANGTAGQPNQILMTNSGGVSSWVNLNEYKEFQTFTLQGTASWTVPEGITKIVVEVWGAGGGGSCTSGGGGGAYITGYFTVSPGSSISYTIGNNGSGVGCGTTVANNGGASTVTVGSTTITAGGGSGNYAYSSSGNWLGRGGVFSVSPASFKNWLGIPGQDGKPNKVSFTVPSAGTIWETTECGDGGNAGNTTHTGGGGGYTIFNVTSPSMVKYITTGIAHTPGGGGCANADRGSAYYGAPGADGMVIFHF